MKYFYLFTISMITMCISGCATMEKEETTYRENLRKENNEMSRLGQDNLDDDLNATERKAVDPIFEKNRKERERADKAVFGVLDPEE